MAFDSPLAQFIMACSDAGLGNSTRKRKQAQRTAKAIHKQAKRQRRTTAVCTAALAVNHMVKETIRKS